MPSCICGRYFTQSSYQVSSVKYNKEDDLCPSCLASSNPIGYMSSKEWCCQNVTGMLLSDSGDNSKGGGGSSGCNED